VEGKQGQTSTLGQRCFRWTGERSPGPKAVEFLDLRIAASVNFVVKGAKEWLNL
jgi:hypothetical protein